MADNPNDLDADNDAMDDIDFNATVDAGNDLIDNFENDMTVDADKDVKDDDIDVIDDTRGHNQPLDSNTPLTLSIKLRDFIFESYLEDEARNALQNDLDGVPDENGIFIPHMARPGHFHSKNFIRCRAYLRSMVELIDEADFDHDDKVLLKLFNKVSGFWRSANSLKQLERFADQRQPELNVEPLPDGSNLTGVLLHEWWFRRLWIRNLHFPGLFARNKGRRESFDHLYEAARGLLDVERARCTPDRGDGYHPSYTNPDDPRPIAFWVSSSRLTILEILENMAALPYTRNEQEVIREARMRRTGQKYRPLDQGITAEDLFRQNFKQYPRQTFNSMIDRYNELMQEHPFERLLMELLDKEETFEQTLSVEHIEDQLLNKHFTAYDEKYLLNSTRGRSPLTRRQNPFDISALLCTYNEEGFGEETESNMIDFLRDIAAVNRQRRDFRLMRDWIDHRPWKLLIQPYDLKNGNGWMANALQIYDHQDLSRFPDKQFSHPVNVRLNMFGITPTDGEKLTGLSPCFLCKRAFTAGNTFDHTIMRLHCDHLFHLKCIFEYWDHPNKHTHSCPQCGQMPSLMHERVGIVPGAEDPAFDANNVAFVYNLAGYTAPDIYRRGGRSLQDPSLQSIPRKKWDAMRSVFYDVPMRRVGKGGVRASNPYWDKETALLEAYDKADVFWIASEQSDNIFRSAKNPIAIMARETGRRYTAAHRQRFGEPSLANRYKYFNTSRFPLEVEMAFMRQQRKKRNVNDRVAVKLSGSGIAGLQ